MNKHGAIRF